MRSGASNVAALFDAGGMTNCRKSPYAVKLTLVIEAACALLKGPACRALQPQGVRYFLEKWDSGQVPRGQPDQVNANSERSALRRR
jgi:hypothetical protein